MRLWNLDSGDNFVLTGSTGSGGHSEFISSLAWCEAKSSLAAGTNLGNILMWRHVISEADTEEENTWHQEPVSRVGLAVKQLSWGSHYNLLSVNTVREVFILREHQISAHHNNSVAAVQTSPTQVSVYLENTSTASTLSSDIQVRGIFVTGDNVIVWNGHRVLVYDIIHDSNRFLSQVNPCL